MILPSILCRLTLEPGLVMALHLDQGKDVDPRGSLTTLERAARLLRTSRLRTRRPDALRLGNRISIIALVFRPQPQPNPCTRSLPPYWPVETTALPNRNA